VRIAWWKLSTGRCRASTLTGLASARPICWGASLPGAARAAAGKAMAAIRAGTIYVRFVSKRGTLEGLPALVGDRRHIGLLICINRHELRHGAAGVREPVKRIVQ
jgi:hypothetical protein